MRFLGFYSGEIHHDETVPYGEHKRAARRSERGVPIALTTGSHATEQPIRTLIRAGFDRYKWSRFHARLVTALGVAGILDGLEIKVASEIADLFEKKETDAHSSSPMGKTARARWDARPPARPGQQDGSP